jgi:hypothetical protein
MSSISPEAVFISPEIISLFPMRFFASHEISGGCADCLVHACMSNVIIFYGSLLFCPPLLASIPPFS